MSDPSKDGGPAFPHCEYVEIMGMSLRDYFAGQALAGLVATCRDREAVLSLAPACYAAADALLTKRKEFYEKTQSHL